MYYTYIMTLYVHFIQNYFQDKLKLVYLYTSICILYVNHSMCAGNDNQDSIEHASLSHEASITQDHKDRTGSSMSTTVLSNAMSIADNIMPSSSDSDNDAEDTLLPPSELDVIWDGMPEQNKQVATLAILGQSTPIITLSVKPIPPKAPKLRPMLEPTNIIVPELMLPNSANQSDDAISDLFKEDGIFSLEEDDVSPSTVEPSIRDLFFPTDYIM